MASRRRSADAKETSRSSSPSASAEALRKLKHRELVKRSYYQKLEVLKQLRQQERSLSAQHSALLRYSQTRPPVATAGGPPATILALHEKYIQLTRDKELEVRVNQTLLKTHSQHQISQKKLKAFAAAEQKERRDERADRSSPEPSQEPEADPAALGDEMKLVTADMCCEVICPAYTEIRSFRTSRDLYTSNVQVLGWTHRHRLEGSNLQYSIAKFFPALTARELCDRGWEIMTTESSYRALHSQGMTSNLHSIQVVDDDNRVFCRELQRPGQGVIMKTLFLASRFETEDGHMTIYRALDHAKLGFTGVNSSSSDTSLRQALLASKWLDMFAWTSFEDRSDGSGVEFNFGGEMKHFSVDNAHFWMMEVLLMALRWESRAVGPLITLQPSE
ncbi:hypothetical protein PHYBOEH_010894 [Phytophthora boehmeriae]|uniref:Uncharacterized protein n=1 Tax=Phytophthora boehmeriae TaxID=109152 RepID=A0A8T1X4G7_9STRA|nr:hypothetical protein PHYBOEH_010894 [Phytophthora boehmeriae]